MSWQIDDKKGKEKRWLSTQGKETLRKALSTCPICTVNLKDMLKVLKAGDNNSACLGMCSSNT